MGSLIDLFQEKIERAMQVTPEHEGVWHLLRLKDTVNKMYEQKHITDLEYKITSKSLEDGIYILSEKEKGVY